MEQAVAGLAQEGKVICVRLALFAQMMKDRPWTPASLRGVGGPLGVGATFLEETFSAAGAPPEHRYHQEAARAVLGGLLPGAGTDIKGHMRPEAELLALSGYADRLRDFDGPAPHPRRRAAAHHAGRPGRGGGWRVASGGRRRRAWTLFARRPRLATPSTGHCPPASLQPILPAHARLPRAVAAGLADPEAAGDAVGDGPSCGWPSGPTCGAGGPRPASCPRGGNGCPSACSRGVGTGRRRSAP